MAHLMQNNPPVYGRTYVGHIQCMVLNMYMNGTCMVHVWYMYGTCMVHVWSDTVHMQDVHVCCCVCVGYID